MEDESSYRNQQQRAQQSAPYPSSDHDMDMVSLDTTRVITHMCIFQVISITIYKLYFHNIQDRNTTSSFIISRISEELYKPRIKMRRTAKQDARWISTGYMYVLLYIHGKSAAVNLSTWSSLVSCMQEQVKGTYFIHTYTNECTRTKLSIHACMRNMYEERHEHRGACTLHRPAPADYRLRHYMGLGPCFLCGTTTYSYARDAKRRPQDARAAVFLYNK